MIRFIPICLIAVAELNAQSLSFGVKAGAQLTSSVEGNGSDAGQRFVVGPTVEIGLPLSLAFEADALFRRSGYNASVLSQGTTFQSQVIGTAIEIPLLAKYYIGPKLLPAKLYAVGGYSFRYTASIGNQYVTRDNPVNGVVLGGGAKFRLGRFSISPEIRYTHYAGTTLYMQVKSDTVQSVRDQADFLVGFTF